MWVILNDAMLSIVQHKDDPTMFAVRARARRDLQRVFPTFKNKIIETDDSDYRFRIFADRDLVQEQIASEVGRINYVNFKNSVQEKDRYSMYTKIWQVLFNWQETNYPRETQWWLNYRK